MVKFDQFSEEFDILAEILNKNLNLVDKNSFILIFYLIRKQKNI